MAGFLVFVSYIALLIAFIFLGLCALVAESPGWMLAFAGVFFVGAMMLNVTGRRNREFHVKHGADL